MPARPLEIRGTLETSYPDVFTPEALSALAALAPLDADRKAVMKARIARRAARVRDRQRIAFLDPQSVIPRTQIKVQDAREGKFIGSEIPGDLRRQWIQGTGPAARPGATVETALRNVAYALLSGADGWMFDGEDALGQVSSMSLDNQRNLKLAIHRDPVFLKVAEQVAGEMNTWAKGFFGRETIADWRKQLDFTTKIFRARGLHLDDRHVRHTNGESFSASIVDLDAVRGEQLPAASTTRGRRSSSTCRRFRPRKRRRCGTTCSRRSNGIWVWRSARSRSTCWWNRSKPASS